MIQVNFPKWMSLLHSGFSIVTYGLGSKKSLIHNFHAEYLSGGKVFISPSKSQDGFAKNNTAQFSFDLYFYEVMRVSFFSLLSKSRAFQWLLRYASWLQRKKMDVSSTSWISFFSSGPNSSIPGIMLKIFDPQK